MAWGKPHCSHFYVYLRLPTVGGSNSVGARYFLFTVVNTGHWFPPPRLIHNGRRLLFPAGKAAVARRWSLYHPPSSATVEKNASNWRSTPIAWCLIGKRNSLTSHILLWCCIYNDTMTEISDKVSIGVQSNPKYCEGKWAFQTSDRSITTSSTSQMFFF